MNFMVASAEESDGQRAKQWLGLRLVHGAGMAKGADPPTNAPEAQKAQELCPLMAFRKMGADISGFPWHIFRIWRHTAPGSVGNETISERTEVAVA